MNEMISWIQSYWYELGMLLAQLFLLVAGVWYARRILKAMRASQQQFGALLKLSLSDELNQRVKSEPQAHRPTPYVSADWPAMSETVTPQEAPALTPEGQHRGGIIAWFKAPLWNGPTPWRRVVRWLQAPARS